MEKKELDGLLGQWKLPNQNKTITGMISVVNDIIVMKTIELFGDLKDLEVESYKLIIGFTSNGKKITLLNCMKKRIKISFPGMMEFVFRPEYIIVGQQFESTDIQLTSISSHYYGLEEWLNMKPIQFTINNEKQVDMQYGMSKSYVCHLKNLNLSIVYKSNIHVEECKSFEIAQSARIKFEFNSKKTIEDAMKELYIFGQFLTLCMGSYYKIDNIKACSIEDDKLSILGNYPSLENPSLRKEFFVDFNFTVDELEKSLCIWWEKYCEIEPIINYFVEAYDHPENVISYFLRMVQALESYSRKMRRGTLIPPDEHNNRIHRILSIIKDKDDELWLNQVLETPILNEPTCQQRISRLLKETSSFFTISNKKVKSISYKIVTTRNYYTHFNENLKEQVISDELIYYYSTFLRFVLQVLLMRELEIPEQVILKKMHEDYELSNVKKVLAGETKIIPIKVIEGKRVEKET